MLRWVKICTFGSDSKTATMTNTSLQVYLQNAGYDLIDGPIRNQKPLQLWLKDGFNQAELYYESVHHAFASPVKLKTSKDVALAVDDKFKNDYAFQIGMTVVQEMLQSMGLQPIELDAAFRSGKRISVSFKNTMTEVLPIGVLTDFFSQADFLHPNPILLRHANKNKLLLITGVVTAEQLVVEMEMDAKLNTKLLAGLKKSSKGRIEFSSLRNNTLKMVAGAARFPIAIKASRLDFDKGRFTGLSLVTDGRDLF